MICPNCGTPNENGELFCHICGAELPAPEELAEDTDLLSEDTDLLSEDTDLLPESTDLPAEAADVAAEAADVIPEDTDLLSEKTAETPEDTGVLPADDVYEAPFGFTPPVPQAPPVQPQFTQPQPVQPQYTQPQYTQPQYTQPQYTQPQYTQPQPAQPQAAPPAKKKSKALPVIIAAAAVLIAAGVAVALLFRFGILPPGAKNADGKDGEKTSQDAGKTPAPADDVTDAPEDDLPAGTAVGYRGEALDAFFAVEYATYSGSLDAMTAQERADGAFDELEYTYSFYAKAKAEGMMLDDAHRTLLEDDMAYMEEQAVGYGSENLNAYLQEAFGSQLVTEESLRAYLEMYYLSAQYQEKKMDAAYASVTDQMIQEKLESSNDYYTVDLRLFGLLNEDGAQEKAEKMLSRITDEASFVELCREYCTEDQREVFENDDGSLAKHIYRSPVAMNVGEDLAEWLFSDERSVGDKRVYVADDAVYVVMVKQTVYLDQDPLASARHILISFSEIEQAEAGTDETVTDLNGNEITAEGTQYSADVVRGAYVKAKAIYDEYMAGSKTEEAFAALADRYSDDTASTSLYSDSEGGGLYADIEKGQFVTPFEDWVYDPARQPGDVDIIKTAYGWHIMYYVGHQDEPVWKGSIRAALGNEVYSAETGKIYEAFKGSLQKGDSYAEFYNELYNNLSQTEE